MNAPSFGRLTLVELRKMVDTRAGFWLQLTVAVITLAAVVVIRPRGLAAGLFREVSVGMRAWTMVMRVLLRVGCLR